MFTTPDTTQDDQLKSALDAAIASFNTRRSALLKQAFDEGGDATVARLEENYDALRGAYFDLLKRQLDRNNARYVELTKAAKNEAAELQEAIASLAGVASIIKLATSVIGLVARVITVLGV